MFGVTSSPVEPEPGTPTETGQPGGSDHQPPRRWRARAKSASLRAASWLGTLDLHRPKYPYMISVAPLPPGPCASTQTPRTRARARSTHAASPPGLALLALGGQVTVYRGAANTECPGDLRGALAASTARPGGS
jgi:hypothetical protein